jgi:hypothetical protein
MHSIGWCTLYGDLELGDLCLGGIAGRVWRGLGDSTVGVNVLLVSVIGMVVKILNDLVWVDLKAPSKLLIRIEQLDKGLTCLASPAIFAS